MRGIKAKKLRKHFGEERSKRFSTTLSGTVMVNKERRKYQGAKKVLKRMKMLKSIV